MSSDELSDCIARLESYRRGRPGIQRAGTQDVRLPRDLLHKTIELLHSIVIQRREADESASRTTVVGARSSC